MSISMLIKRRAIGAIPFDFEIWCEDANNNQIPPAYFKSEVIRLHCDNITGATYYWTGPNGWYSTNRNPNRGNCQIGYSGTYTCRVTVDGVSVSKSIYVGVYPNPTPDFTYDGTYAGFSTTFTDATVVDPVDSEITSYLWDFGDGETSTLQNPTHLFAESGTYDVTLTVSTGGPTKTITKQVTISEIVVGCLDEANGNLIEPAYSKGQRIRLYCDSITGASYYWEGPNGWYSYNQLPLRANCALTWAGEYTCTITKGTEIVTKSVNVIVFDGLRFKATADNSSVKLKKNSSFTGDLNLEYSTTTNGIWTPYTIDTVISLDTNDYVIFRGINETISTEHNRYSFEMTGTIEASGSVDTLLSYRTTNVVLQSCCYYSLFDNCASLTTAPQLPSTTLSSNCYFCMFQGCTSLTSAPNLPATSLSSYCYREMFRNCTSLTSAPTLLAATLSTGCYYYMFCGCTSLNSITCLATDISASNCTYAWVYHVSPTGTFTKAASMNGWTTGNNGIPSDWIVQDYSE